MSKLIRAELCGKLHYKWDMKWDNYAQWQGCVNMYMCVMYLDIYILYAEMEEKHGLLSTAMSIYERASKAVLPEEQMEVIC